MRNFLMAIFACGALISSPSKCLGATADNSLYQLLSKVSWINLAKPVTPEQLEGRVMLLDFWTFCCINCMHVIPDLHRLEQEFGDKLVVLGIHSAKFENERDSDQISQAVQKYGIHHPVANDSSFLLWRALGIQAWPSFALVNAEGKVVDILSGEGIYDKAHDSIAALIKEADSKGQLKRNTFVVTAPHRDSVLRFPGKLLYDPAQKRVFISDSEHQKIRVLDLSGRELESIGSGVQGLLDGDFKTAQLHSPQGLALKGDKLYIADTENHALRIADLKQKKMTTLFGDGRQAHISYWDNTLSKELNSPWDLEWNGDDLLITMAGTHQLYRLDKQGKLHRFAGTGQENLHDGSLDQAALAQPSGLSRGPNGHIYFVDSETSSLREIANNEVHTLIGEGLFEFGLKDGKKPDARLQHPLGVQAAKDKIYVADTYNHAIRVFDLKTKQLSTLAGGKAGLRDGPVSQAQFREPNDLALVGDELWVTDTNNDALRAINLKSLTARTVEVKPLASASAPTLPNLKFQREVAINKSKPFIIRWQLPAGMKLNAKAPSQIKVLSAQGPTQTLDARMAMGSQLEFDPKQATGLEGTFYFCNSDNTGSCRIESMSIKLKAGGTEHEILWKLGTAN